MTKQRWVWPILWAGSIFATSSGVITVGQLATTVNRVAAGHVSEDSFRHFWRLVWWIFVKGWHATEFGVLYLLAKRALPKAPAWAVALPCLYAFADEAHQLLVPNRGCRLSDVCIDCLGILAAWVLSHRLIKRRWLAASIIAFIAAVFLLSIHPFGLVRLPQTITNTLAP